MFCQQQVLLAPLQQLVRQRKPYDQTSQSTSMTSATIGLQESERRRHSNLSSSDLPHRQSIKHSPRSHPHPERQTPTLNSTFGISESRVSSRHTSFTSVSRHISDSTEPTHLRQQLKPPHQGPTDLHI